MALFTLMHNPILVTRPKHDLVTRYLCAWCEEFVNEVRSKGIDVYDLEGTKATKSKFENYIKAHNPSFLFLNGHGDSATITGHDNKTLVDSNTTLSSATVLYARSCDAGQILGPHLVKKGLCAFIGYKRKFILGYIPDKIWSPLKDPIAQLFLESSNLVPSTLVKGHTVEEAHVRSRTQMYSNFRKMVSSAATYEERYAARWLWSNLNNQVFFGNPMSTI